MQVFEINGKRKLFGEIEIGTAKNAVLPVIAASILCDEKVEILAVPNLVDVHKMCDILKIMGAKVSFALGSLCIDNSSLCNFEIPQPLAHEIRSSIFMLGPLLAKHKRAKVCYPGGCDIGARPIDLHLSGLKALGVKIVETGGNIFCDGTNMKAGFVHLDFPSVGATENIVMASVFLKGVTTIENVAKEPEIVDLANFINKMGGNIKGAGTSTIKVYGVKKLHGVAYTCIPDRICAGTFLLATAIAGGKVWIKNVVPEHIFSLIVKLRNCGCLLTFNDNSICVQNNLRLHSIANVDTQPFPGFPTDLQAPMMAYLSTCKGVCVVTENLFENRFKHAYELIKMGAKILVKDRTAVVEGVKELNGAFVNASDLRAGAGLCLAGLSANGKTTVSGVEFVDRGYESFERSLQKLGADVVRKTI